MTCGGVLEALSAKAGIFGEFWDLQHILRPTAPETHRALLAACGLPAATDEEARQTLAALEAEEAALITGREIVLPSGHPGEVNVPEGTEWEAVLETGERAGSGLSDGRIALPPLPPGVHDLHLKRAEATQSVLLIAAPGRLPSLAARGLARIWGVVGTVYGLCSGRNFGVGDFADLGAAAEALATKDASFYGINPVHALGWSTDTVSPYSPTHRGFLNAWHIAPDKAAEFCASPSMAALVAEAAPRFEAVRGSQTIDYAGHRALLRPLLERSYEFFRAEAPGPVRDDLAAFRCEGGDALEDFALFETLSEIHGADWRCWPAQFQHRDTVARTDDLQARMDFHIWLQWLADRQLSAAQARAGNAGMPVGVYLDLAVGARLGGAESWCERGSVAEGVSIGAPPDYLSPAGQNWDLAAYAPRKLARDRYAALRRLLQRIMRHCGLLRIDHVLGLKRSFWVPQDGSPGGYIRQPFRTLAAIIAIEAHKSDTIIVGEDLGLVPEGFRDELSDLGFYGYSVLQYEKTDGVLHDPSTLREHSLACFATHDTPTVRGYWEAADIDWWERLGWIEPGEKACKQAERRNEAAGLLANAPQEYRAAGDAAGFRNAMHATLAQSPAELVAVQLDDILDEREAQNLPSTIEEHPNWLRRCSVPVEDLTDLPQLEELRMIMQKGGRNTEGKLKAGSQAGLPEEI